MVCYCHGYGDTCTFFFEGMWLLLSSRNDLVFRFVYYNRYWRFLWYCISGIARKLALSGYGVFSMDYPGFGLSEGLHGFIPSFDRIVDDVIEHYSKVKGVLTYQILLLSNLRMFVTVRKLWNFLWNESWGMTFCFIFKLKLYFISCCLVKKGSNISSKVFIFIFLREFLIFRL